MKQRKHSVISQQELPVMTREDALSVFRAGPDAVADLILSMDAQIRALRRLEARIEELEGRLAKTSRNSSKPPSSDGPSKPPAPKSMRKSSGLKPGGQKGHQGRTLRQAERADHTQVHTVEYCGACSQDIRGCAPERTETRQVFDIPPVRLEVTEHCAEVKTCPHCSTVNRAVFPEGINAPVQYGPVLKAAAVYLNEYQLLPYARLCECMSDLFGAALSEGTLANMIAEASGLAEESVEEIAEMIRNADTVHFDETGARREGKTVWLHSAGTERGTVFHIDPKRGAEAMDRAGILPGFTGSAVHDFWKSYYKYDECRHALCNAHHLRDLIYIHEQLGQEWADEAAELLLAFKDEAEAARLSGRSGFSSKELDEYNQRWQQLIDKGYAANPWKPPGSKKRGRPAKGKARNLIERFDQRRHEVLAFVHDFNVPFDNNLAERDIRMNKVKQKVSGGFRSEEHARHFCILRSYIYTARKNAVRAFDALTLLFNGSPFIPERC